MNTRNTKQKEIIFEVLCKMKSHPTILELYEAVHAKDSSIGQATVYRNVSKLMEENMVRKVLTSDGVLHYDANCNNHCHFRCKKCQKVFDVFDVDTQKLLDVMKINSSFESDDVYVLFEGICSRCR